MDVNKDLEYKHLKRMISQMANENLIEIKEDIEDILINRNSDKENVPDQLILDITFADEAMKMIMHKRNVKH